MVLIELKKIVISTIHSYKVHWNKFVQQNIFKWIHSYKIHIDKIILTKYI